MKEFILSKKSLYFSRKVKLWSTNDLNTVNVRGFFSNQKEYFHMSKKINSKYIITNFFLFIGICQNKWLKYWSTNWIQKAGKKRTEISSLIAVVFFGIWYFNKASSHLTSFYSCKSRTLLICTPCCCAHMDTDPLQHSQSYWCHQRQFLRSRGDIIIVFIMIFAVTSWDMKKIVHACNLMT